MLCTVYVQPERWCWVEQRDGRMTQIGMNNSRKEDGMAMGMRIRLRRKHWRRWVLLRFGWENIWKLLLWKISVLYVCIIFEFALFVYRAMSNGRVVRWDATQAGWKFGKFNYGMGLTDDDIGNNKSRWWISKRI